VIEVAILSGPDVKPVADRHAHIPPMQKAFACEAAMPPFCRVLGRSHPRTLGWISLAKLRRHPPDAPSGLPREGIHPPAPWVVDTLMDQVGGVTKPAIME
jgi:hypothetical protein